MCQRPRFQHPRFQCLHLQRLLSQRSRFCGFVLASASMFLLSPTFSAAQTDIPIDRWAADQVECPKGTELRQVESPDGQYSAMWCEASRGSKVARHGPYLELFADGSTARQGLYFRGIQTGRWVRWAADGTVERDLILWPGEASGLIPSPEDLCPSGSQRVRSTGHDHRRRMWSKCQSKDASGQYVLQGPRVTWDEERSKEGAVRYILRRIVNYRDGERHGLHREFEGPFGREVRVIEETFVEGNLDGESRAFFRDGTLRELRQYRNGSLHGERISYYANGTERWRATYESGRQVAAEGDLTIAGEPCPKRTMPVISADGREEFCARRYIHYLEKHGPFIERDENGLVVESGLYEKGEKTEIWEGDGRKATPDVAEDLLVAEGQLMLGEQVYDRLNSPPPEEPEVLLEELEHLDVARDLQRQQEDEQAARMAKERYDVGEGPEAREGLLEAIASADGDSADGDSADGVSGVEEARSDERLVLNDDIEVLGSAERDPPVEFHIWFRNMANKKYPSAKTVVEDGRVKIYGLAPGKYYMRVEIDANPQSPRQYPGDLTSSSTFEVRTDEFTQFEAPLFYSLHLVEPFDNDQDIPGWSNPCGEAEAVSRKVRFVWSSPIPEGDSEIEYTYRVRKYRCDFPRAKDVVVEGKTYGTSVTLDLPPSSRGESYDWTLLARRGDKVIGELMTFGNGGHGWSLRFRVE